jgi:enoyl-CoA hydratase
MALKITTHNPGVRLLTLSRPEALNALNTQVLAELKKELSQAAQDPEVRVVVLTGEGSKSFIAGADILEMKDKAPQEGVEFAQLGHEVTKLLELMPKPTIAAVNGYALGGGCEMAMACDFILAAENAIFGQPEVGLGIIPGFGGTVRLAKLVGLARAKELIFSGRKVNAEEARMMGLVARVFPQEGFLEKALESAAQISKNSASAVSRSKQLLNEFSESVGLNSKLDAEAHAFGRLFGTFDQKEGMGAFSEKRKPAFQGLTH